MGVEDPGPEVELEAEVGREEVGVAKVFEADDAGDAFEELDVMLSPEAKLDDEEALSVLVGRNTPLYVVEAEEEETWHTSDEDEQQGMVVLVVAFVENTPPYPEGKQLTVWELAFSCGLRKTPSYMTRLHVLVDEDDVVVFPNGRLDDGHGVQEAIRGWKAKTPRYPPAYKVAFPRLFEDVTKEGSVEVLIVGSWRGRGTGCCETTMRFSGLPMLR